MEKLSNWSHRRPRMAAITATLAVVFVLAVLFTTYQASMETAMVARAHDLIDEIEDSLVQIQTDIATQEEKLRRMPEGPERFETEARLADLEAQLEVAEDERRSYALAVTGFTILSPDDRAITILRQSTLDEIRSLIENEDYFRARATIQGTLRNFEAGNLVELSATDHEMLLSELEDVEHKIERARRTRGASDPESEPGHEGP